MKDSTRIILLIFVCVLFSALPLFAGGSAETAGPEQPSAREADSEKAEDRQDPYPLRLTDALGKKITLEKRPERVISLTLFTDEMLTELLESGRLIGVTTFAADPVMSNVADRVERIPNKLTLNIEVILSLRPDIILTADWSEADKIEQLRNAGIKVYQVKTPTSYDEIQETIDLLSHMFDVEEEGKELKAQMDRKLRELREKVETIEAEDRLTVIDYAVWGTSPGKGSSWQNMVRLAGLKNAVAEEEANEWGQVPVSKEKLVELDPDILILPGWVYGDPDGAEGFKKQVTEDPALQDLTAIENDRVYQMPEYKKGTVSQYFVEGVEYLAERAYPELFE